MNTRPRLTRSIPFWGLVVGSAASIGFGVWLTVDKLTVMEAKLLDGSATGVEVYGGQAWVVFAAAFIVAGLVGLIAALALGAAKTFTARPVEVVEAISWQQEEPEVEIPADEPVVTAPASEAPTESEPANR
ncbi:dinucleotide-utilizing enzyme [Microbacterium sp. cx-55]|uniref:dinucleotide-utilizing enzyme n=1 Tax=unclassified Microbacterium TaxID=2609290 RepID=UPI001CC02D0B|nr:MULTISPECIES: dinucleotide-utilizing enzyme [unclassified Microbacterium]MBZ4486504.1 dinucleotide-utilizing enzyme [Microbacterium sp. cx-55]MCC4907477.1 dinucleotide-utilizing enzyme [Microbacterium sp. cx-59]UGB36528.1 dinucleotide-utilizing enzyme [Microbacterium sp. cx-55]